MARITYSYIFVYWIHLILKQSKVQANAATPAKLDIPFYWKTSAATDIVPDYWNHGSIFIPGLQDRFTMSTKKSDIFPPWLTRTVHSETPFPFANMTIINRVMHKTSSTEATVPQTLTERVRPRTITEATVPQTLTERVRPQTITEATVPQTLTERVRPRTITEATVPQTLTERVGPRTTTEATVPETLTERVRPRTITENINQYPKTYTIMVRQEKTLSDANATEEPKPAKTITNTSPSVLYHDFGISTMKAASRLREEVTDISTPVIHNIVSNEIEKSPFNVIRTLETKKLFKHKETSPTTTLKTRLMTTLKTNPATTLKTLLSSGALQEFLETVPFSLFLRNFLRALSVKSLADVSSLVEAFINYMTQILTSGKLSVLGVETNLYLTKTIRDINKEPDALHKNVSLAYNILVNRVVDLANDVNELLEYMDDTYDEGEEEAMQEVLELTTQFPIAKKTAEEIAQSFVNDVFLNPLQRVSGTWEGTKLFNMITNVVSKRISIERRFKEFQKSQAYNFLREPQLVDEYVKLKSPSDYRPDIDAYEIKNYRRNLLHDDRKRKHPTISGNSGKSSYEGRNREEKSDYHLEKHNTLRPSFLIEDSDETDDSTGSKVQDIYKRKYEKDKKENFNGNNAKNKNRERNLLTFASNKIRTQEDPRLHSEEAKNYNNKKPTMLLPKRHIITEVAKDDISIFDAQLYEDKYGKSRNVTKNPHTQGPITKPKLLITSSLKAFRNNHPTTREKHNQNQPSHKQFRVRHEPTNTVRTRKKPNNREITPTTKAYTKIKHKIKTPHNSNNIQRNDNKSKAVNRGNKKTEHDVADNEKYSSAEDELSDDEETHSSADDTISYRDKSTFIRTENKNSNRSHPRIKPELESKLRNNFARKDLTLDTELYKESNNQHIKKPLTMNNAVKNEVHFHKTGSQTIQRNKHFMTTPSDSLKAHEKNSSKLRIKSESESKLSYRFPSENLKLDMNMYKELDNQHKAHHKKPPTTNNVVKNTDYFRKTVSQSIQKNKHPTTAPSDSLKLDDLMSSKQLNRNTVKQTNNFTKYEMKTTKKSAVSNVKVYSPSPNKTVIRNYDKEIDKYLYDDKEETVDEIDDDSSTGENKSSADLSLGDLDESMIRSTKRTKLYPGANLPFRKHSKHKRHHKYRHKKSKHKKHGHKRLYYSKKKYEKLKRKYRKLKKLRDFILAQRQSYTKHEDPFQIPTENTPKPDEPEVIDITVTENIVLETPGMNENIQRAGDPKDYNNDNPGPEEIDDQVPQYPFMGPDHDDDHNPFLKDYDANDDFDGLPKENSEVTPELEGVPQSEAVPRAFDLKLNRIKDERHTPLKGAIKKTKLKFAPVRPKPNKVIEPIFRATEDSYEETQLKDNLYDAFRHLDYHDDKYFNVSRRSMTHGNSADIPRDSYETDYEAVLKRNIYKAVKKLLK